MRSASTLGKKPTLLSYSERVAISRRRYHCRNSSLCYSVYIPLRIGNKVIIFLYRRSRTFFTAKGGFLYLRLFSLPSGRRGWGWRGIAESSLSRYYTTHTDAKGKALKSHKSFCRSLLLHIHSVSRRYLPQDIIKTIR